MWAEMFEMPLPLLDKVLRAALIYALALALIRINGKRSLASMNNMDFVVLLLLASAVGDAALGADTSITGGLVTAVVFVACNWLVNRLTDRVPWIQQVIEGTPTTVIEHGEPVRQALRRLGMRHTELDHAVRSQQGDTIEEVEHGELTPNGQLVLSLKPEEQSATKGDVDRLQQRLERMEALLARLARA